MKGFVKFIKTQGIVGLAVGFILGSEVSKVAAAFVNDLVSPVLSLLLVTTGNLNEAYIKIGSAYVMWGHFLNIIINFLIIAFIIYIMYVIFKRFGLGAEK